MRYGDLNIRRIIPPVEYPVSLSEVKDQLRLDDNDEDAYLVSLIALASEYFDLPNGALGTAVMRQQWRYKFSPSAIVCDRIWLPVIPVLSIISFSYLDVSIQPQSIDATKLKLGGSTDRPYLSMIEGQYFPSMAKRGDSITLDFEVGYSSRRDIPAPIKHAILLLITHFYENRSATTNESALKDLPIGIEALISGYKVGHVA